MSTYNTETIARDSVIPSSEHEGPQLRPPDELVDELIRIAGVSRTSRSMIAELLFNSGLSVNWTELEGGQYDGKFPQGAHEAMQVSLADKQREAEEIYDLANERLPGFKKHIAEGLAKYGRNLGIEDTELEELFTVRIANIGEVKLAPTLAQGNAYQYTFRNSSDIASFERKTGALRIDPQAISASSASTSLSPGEIISRAINHELEHAESVGVTTPDGSWSVQAGLNVLPLLDNGNRGSHGSILLDEGAQEQIRWRHLDGIIPVYEKEVMFWETMIALDPNIEKLRFEAKFLGQNRSVLIGRIESLLGPHAVEELEDFCMANSGILNFPAFKDKLIGMIDVFDADPEKRAEKTKIAKQIARQRLDKTQYDILAPRGFDFTDEEMIRAKDLGATAANQVRGILARSK